MDRKIDNMEKVICIIDTPTHKEGELVDRFDLELDRLNFPQVYRQYNKFDDLQAKVIAWAREKEILAKTTPLTQIEKTQEELDELKEALHFQSLGETHYINSKNKAVKTEAEVEDGIADCLITLIIQAEMQGLNIVDCLEVGYNVISKRTGKIIDGMFVKDEK